MSDVADFSKKPREYWVFDDWAARRDMKTSYVAIESGRFGFNEVHVIEKSAYDELKAALDKLLLKVRGLTI